MNQVTECINCGWKQADTILAHDEYVAANPMKAWLCDRRNGTVVPPRPQNADPVLDDDGNVIGYAVRS